MSISLRQLTKHYGSLAVCDHIDLDIASGEMLALLGPSGSGKTTLLRLIAGLERPDEGRVLFDGQDSTSVDVRERDAGFVFQHYALFNHMSVFENVAFGLRVKPRATRPAETEIGRRVNELIERVQLDGLAQRLPWQLSGGQRQRVALARALAVQPKVLLLDEPFGALDARVRKSLRRWLRDLHEDLHVTSVFVTHDQEEAMEVADRVVVMQRGRIEQIGTPAQVYEHPASPFVLQFLGDANALTTDAAGGASYVRPHDISVLGAPQADTVAATLTRALTVGAVTRLAFERQDRSGGIDVELSSAEYRRLTEQLALSPGAPAHLQPRRVMVFEAPAG